MNLSSSHEGILSHLDLTYRYPSINDGMPFPPAEYTGHNPNNFDYKLSNYMLTYYESLLTRSWLNSFRQPGFDFNATKFETYGPPLYGPKYKPQQVKMAWGLTEILSSTLSADGKVRTEAEGRLGQFHKECLPGLLLSLSHELSNDAKPLESRKLAGILLKNYLDSKDPYIKEHYVLKWKLNDLSFKSQIKGLLLNTLGSSVSEARHIAARVIAKIASIELPRKEWPELIDSLLRNVTQQGRPSSLKQASLDALGYICEEISHNRLVQDKVNSVPTVVVQGITMAVEITEFLLSAQSADGKVRTEAEGRLWQFQEQNLPGLLLSLSLELVNDVKPLESRKLAGILLKNSLDAKDATTKEHLVQLWVSNDVSFRSQIKGLLLNTLGSSVSEAGRTAAQVIAKIASIEIPRKEWPELIGSLLGNVTQQDQPASLKRATLEALGYVCEEISRNDLVQDEVHSVLTAVVHGMNVTEQTDVRLAATTALFNALDFAQTNFENEMDRNYIMKVVCETAMAKEADIRQAAFRCLVPIVSTYYDVLEPYMKTLFELTANAIKGDEEGVALQAIEFWSSICNEEIKLQDFDSCGSGDSHPHRRFIEKALSLLVPMLLETLLKQDEDEDQEDGIWDLSMAGRTCLGLVSRTVGDAIVPLVMPFVQDNISKPDWRSRKVATYAFGSVLEGPTVEKLSLMVFPALEFLLNAMRDQNSHGKYTAAWTLSRLFELLHNSTTGFSVISADNIQHIMVVLLESIKGSPQVAENLCGAIYYFARGYECLHAGYSLLAPYLADIITSLIAVDRTDANDTELRCTAFEKLNERDMLALLCGVMQVIIQKLDSRDETNDDEMVKYCNKLKRSILEVFSALNQIKDVVMDDHRDESLVRAAVEGLGILALALALDTKGRFF